MTFLLDYVIGAILGFAFLAGLSELFGWKEWWIYLAPFVTAAISASHMAYDRKKAREHEKQTIALFD